MDFQSKNVFITGGAGEIGIEVASLLVSMGARVFLTDLRADKLAEAASSVARLGGRKVAFSPADVSISSSVEAAVAACADQAAGGIHGVVNAAGIYPEAPVESMSDQQWSEVLRINLDGTFFVCRAVQKHLAADSSIVNLTSIAAHRGSVRHSHYAAAKAGVLGFSRSFAQEVAPRTRVNCVSPGPVDTAMIRPLMSQAGEKILAATPMRRICRADEVAKAVAFLLSDWASFITAETLHLNGGHYIYG